jgi:hypothetical protein
MPNINPQQKTIVPPSSLDITQQPHSNNIVQPIIVLVARLKQHSQLQPTTGLCRAGRLQQDIRAVVRAEIVASVGAEDARLRVCYAPVGAEVEDFACCKKVSAAYSFCWR